MAKYDDFILALEQEHGVTFLTAFDREQLVELLEEEETTNEHKAIEICDLYDLDSFSEQFLDILILLEQL